MNFDEHKFRVFVMFEGFDLDDFWSFSQEFVPFFLLFYSMVKVVRVPLFEKKNLDQLQSYEKCWFDFATSIQVTSSGAFCCPQTSQSAFQCPPGGIATAKRIEVSFPSVVM